MSLNRFLREYNPNYMEWLDQLQLAECGYYPSATNMESNIDKWLMSESSFKCVLDSNFSYLGKSTPNTLPLISKEFSNKIMDFLTSSIKGTS